MPGQDAAGFAKGEAMADQQGLLEPIDWRQLTEPAPARRAAREAWRRLPPDPPRRLEFARESTPRSAPPPSPRLRVVVLAMVLLALAAAGVAGLALWVNRPPAQKPLRAELDAQLGGLRVQFDHELASMQSRVSVLQHRLAEVHAQLGVVSASIPQRAVDVLDNRLRGVVACLPELQAELGGLSFSARVDRKTGDLAAAALRDASAVSSDCAALLGLPHP
jgi:hypothetical protein